MSTSGKPAYDPVSLSAFDFWSGAPSQREDAFAILRRERPVSWQRPPEDEQGKERARPYWAIVKHQDVCEVGRDFTSFCSGEGVQIDDVPIEIERRFVSFLDMDPPRHTQFRSLVQRAFGPRQITRMEAALQRQSAIIVDRLLERGPCDFVANVSMELLLWTVSELMGVPEQDRRHLASVANKIAGRTDPEYGMDAQAVMRCVEELENAGRTLAKERMKQPGEDLLSYLVQEGMDGAKLTLDEVVSTFVVFIMGGNDNVRHTTSAAMKALCDFPDQRKLLMSDFNGHAKKAIEEFLRWGTTTPTMRRTATCDVVVRGVEIKKGDKVVLFFSSANRDEEVFSVPTQFDIMRESNRHVAFGGGGPHFCIGAPLVRIQLRTLFNTLLHRIPDLEVGEPEYAVGDLMSGVKRMPCHFKH